MRTIKLVVTGRLADKPDTEILEIIRQAASGAVGYYENLQNEEEEQACYADPICYVASLYDLNLPIPDSLKDNISVHNKDGEEIPGAFYFRK